MKSLFKSFNNFTRKIDVFLGVEHTRRDYSLNKKFKINKKNVSREEYKFLKEFFTYYDYENSITTFFSDDLDYMNKLIKILNKEKNDVSIILKEMINSKIFQNEFYKINKYIPFDDLDFSDEEIDILEQIRQFLKLKYLV